MPGETSIGWTDASWNPTVGCSRVSAGCLHCYAKTLHDQRHALYQTTGGVWTPGGKRMPPQYAHPFETVQLMPARLNWPLTVRQPKMIFVNSVSDLLHESVPEDFIRNVFAIMRQAHWHVFQSEDNIAKEQRESRGAPRLRALESPVTGKRQNAGLAIAQRALARSIQA